MLKNPCANAGDLRIVGLISGSERSPGKGTAFYSSILAWRTPWTEEPGGLYGPWALKESAPTEQVVSHLGNKTT